MADRLLEAIKAITAAPIRMIINTSADADHAGGNATIAGAGTTMINRGDLFSAEDTATVLAHENVLLRMTANESSLSRSDVADRSRIPRESSRCTSTTTRSW